MKPIRIAVICLLCMLGLAVRPMATAIQAQSAPVVVTIQNFAFSPATLTISAGTTVVWSNTDSADHTATSDTGVFDASTIPSGQSSSGIAFNTPGTYPYHCAIHPFMKGTIIVLASGVRATATPAPPPPPAATATTAPIATDTPAPTAGSTIAAPSTATAQPTPTTTPVPLFVKLAIGHKTVKSGARQSIKVTTAAGAKIGIVVTFPDGVKKHRSGVAPSGGTYTWSFKQPGGHTTHGSRAAKVAVTVSRAGESTVKASKRYTIS